MYLSLHCGQSQEGETLLEQEQRQLHQVWLVTHREQPGAFKGVSESLLLKCAQAWQTEKQRPKQSSARHLAVSSYLARMDIQHTNESEHDIDIEIEGLGAPTGLDEYSTNASAMRPTHIPLRIAVECEGPTHFTTNTKRSLGHTQLKHRILQLMGWTVVQIPYFQWDVIPHWASMEKKRFLQRKLGITKTIYFGERDISTFKPVQKEKHTRFD